MITDSNVPSSMRRTAAKAAVSTAAILIATAATAAAQNDIRGAKDHPRISRFRGSEIVQYNAAEFGELTIPLANPTSRVPSKAERVEGRVHKILYRLPQTASSHEVFRSYEQELTKTGFKTLYRCAGETQCGHYWPNYIQDTYPLTDRGSGFAMGLIDGDSVRYLAMRGDSPTGQTYLMVFAWEYPNGKKYAIVNTVDRDALGEGLVKVTAEQMAKDIADTGHTAIYGVLFDFDQAVIKPESRPALEQMAALMKRDTRLSVFIVGHTDNVGTLAHNLELSQRRADAVVSALSTNYGVDSKRMTSRGAGPIAPVASNKSEAGRAKNRRVELVER